MAGCAVIVNPAEVMVPHAAHGWMFLAVRWWVRGHPVVAPSAPYLEAVRAMAMGSKDVDMSVARPAVLRAFALVAFAVLGVCSINLLVMDEGAMHPRWARGGRLGWVEKCERAEG